MAVLTTTQLQRHIKKIKFDWVSAADGTASGSTSDEITGKILGFATIPGTVADQPTDQYDIIVTDSDSVDILFGQGANKSNASNQYVTEANLGAVVNSTLTINVTNAGITKKGTAILFVR